MNVQGPNKFVAGENKVKAIAAFFFENSPRVEISGKFQGLLYVAK